MKAATFASNPTYEDFGISIHAAREGGDLEELGLAYDFDEISIHAAREGGDVAQRGKEDKQQEFQSTPPVKAATNCRLQPRM